MPKNPIAIHHMGFRKQAFFGLQNGQKCRVLGFLGEIEKKNGMKGDFIFEE